ncbi:hypothetical protein DMENIID0001_106850 [Sergentomyia squamirostris]
MEEKIKAVERRIMTNVQAKERALLLKRSVEGKARKLPGEKSCYISRVLTAQKLLSQTTQKKTGVVIIKRNSRDKTQEFQSIAKIVSDMVVAENVPKKYNQFESEKEELIDDIDDIPETPTSEKSSLVESIRKHSDLPEKLIQIKNIQNQCEEMQKEIEEILLKKQRNNLELDMKLQKIKFRMKSFDQGLLSLENDLELMNMRFETIQQEKVKIESHFNDYMGNFP